MSEVRASEPDVHQVPKWRGVFLVAIALLLLSAGLAIHQYFRYSTASNRIDHAYQALSAIDELVASVLDGESRAHTFLLTRSAPAFESYRQVRPRVDAAAAALSMLVADDERQSQGANRLIELSRARTDQLQSAVELSEAGRGPDAARRIAGDANQPLMERVRAAAAEMKTAERTVLAQRSE